ncbi:MAG: hypothetical protein ACTSVI_17405 [Promethearchaeota archaeon]
MSTTTIKKHQVAFSLLYFGFSGLFIAIVIAHAQFLVKVGEVDVILLISLTLALLMIYASQNFQKYVEKGLRSKSLKSTSGKGAASRYWFKSKPGEILIKSSFGINLIFLMLYLLMSLILLMAPPIINFVISVDFAGILTLLLSSYFANKK